MRFVFALLLAIQLTIRSVLCQQQLFSQWGDVDRSAIKLCLTLLDGQLGQIDPEDPDKGHFCLYKTKVYTSDQAMAQDFCESHVPYDIMEARSVDDGGTHITECKFRITVNCNGWFQVASRCYMVLETKYTYEEAKEACLKKADASVNSQMASYYSNTFRHYMEHMEFSDAWVQVPNINDHFENFENFENSTDNVAVLVMDGGYKYDVKPGTLILDDLTNKHQALCEYDPGMSKAEMHRVVDAYKKIYPIDAVGKEVIVAASSYTTITSSSRDQFTDKEIRKSCEGVGKAIGVHSFPAGAGIKLVDEYKHVLTDHRFYLSNAIKNSGCDGKSYKQMIHNVNTSVPQNVFVEDEKLRLCNAFSYSINKDRGFATKAAMRAPPLCTLFSSTSGYGPCPEGYFEYERTGKRKFCHFMYQDKEIGFDEAKPKCESIGTHLTGFESQHELESVTDHFNAPHKRTYIGSIIPCTMNCHSLTGEYYRAGWIAEVADDHSFLNENSNDRWNEDGTIELLSRSLQYYPWSLRNVEQPYICGRYATITRQ